MYTKEYTNEIPEIFLKRGGVDGRGHYSEGTSEMLHFLESGNEPYCLLTFDDVKSAKLAANAAGCFALKHKLACKVTRREKYVLFVRNGGAE